ncbi:hypothetical protein AVEN_7700-1, partial [Araneus ventricosus]
DNNEDLLTSWEVFQTELKKVFGDTQLYVRRAKDILKCRSQKSGESTQSYIQDVLGLCHQIDSNMPEDDKVSHLMKGIAEDVYRALLTKEIRTTADFIKWCQHIEEMQQRRIGHTKFTRLPNVVPIASIDKENDLTSLIRKIARDEIQKLTVPQAMDKMDIQSIETIVREEVGRSLNPITSERAKTAYSRPQRPIQETTEPTLEQSPRKTDLWRTTDNRPVCFHCGQLKKVFGDTQLYVRRAKDILKCRAQKSDESTQSYIQDVLGLCHQIDSNMPEDDKVSHLMKGIAEDVYQALLTKEIRTTADFIKWCQNIEEIQQRRIGHTKFTRLPNVVPIASIDTENDLTSLIRKIVRDEIQKLTVPQAMEPQMDIQSIETIVREEVGRSLNSITSERARTAYSRPQRRIQPTTEPTLEQSPRKTDL